MQGELEAAPTRAPQRPLRSPKPSAKPRPTPPTISTCAASRSSRSPAQPRASSRSTIPSAPIFALSPVDVTVNRLNLLWGTTPIRCPKVNTTEAMVECAEKLLEKGGYVRPREVIAIVAGTRTKSGSTNFLRLHVMGENALNGARFLPKRTAELAHPSLSLRRRRTVADKTAKPPARTR